MMLYWLPKIGNFFSKPLIKRTIQRKNRGLYVQRIRKGRTPNPDVLCNREIKFDVFMKIAFAWCRLCGDKSLLPKRNNRKDGKNISITCWD